MRIRGSALVACALLVAACGGPPRALAAGDVTVLVSSPPDGGMEAQGGGTVEVVDGCLGADGSVVIWPHGTEVVGEDPLVVDLPGRGRVGLGDEVLLAGGYVFEPTAPGETYESEVVPASCAGRPVFLSHAAMTG